MGSCHRVLSRGYVMRHSSCVERGKTKFDKTNADTIQLRIILVKKRDNGFGYFINFVDTTSRMTHDDIQRRTGVAN